MSVPQLYSSGCVYIFVGVGDNVQTSTFIQEVPDPTGGSGDTGTGTITVTTTKTTVLPGTRPKLLGTCEDGPTILKNPYFKPMRTAESGMAADDVMFMGEEAMVFGHLNWFDETVYAKICSRPFTQQKRGLAFDDSVGTLMRRERQTYKLWLLFPNSDTSVGPIGTPGIGIRVGAAARGVARAFGPPGIPFEGLTMANMPDGYRFLNTYLMGPDKLSPLGTQARGLDLIWHCIKNTTNASVGRGIVYDHKMGELVGYDFS